MRRVLAFARRDLRIDLNYPLATGWELLYLPVPALTYCFLARFVSGATSAQTTHYEGDYFTFLLVGATLHELMTTALEAFSRATREAQIAGTLEALLVTGTGPAAILAGSAVHPFLWCLLRIGAYLLVGTTLCHGHVRDGNWVGAGLILALAVTAFAGVGLGIAGVTVLFKRGGNLATLVASASWLLAGVLYPVSVLPHPAQALASALPSTWAIEGVRIALLRSSSWRDLLPYVGGLLLFCVVLVPAGLGAFVAALRRARVSGTLGHY